MAQFIACDAQNAFMVGDISVSHYVILIPINIVINIHTQKI